MNQNGSVTAMDAYQILKHAAGLTDDTITDSIDGDWVFVDSAKDYSVIDRRHVDYDRVTLLDNLTSETQVDLTAILIGDVDDSYSAYLSDSSSSLV